MFRVFLLNHIAAFVFRNFSLVFLWLVHSLACWASIIFTVVPCILILSKFLHQLMHKFFNTLRTGSFKLFKRLFPGFLTILTL